MILSPTILFVLKIASSRMPCVTNNPGSLRCKSEELRISINMIVAKLKAIAVIAPKIKSDNNSVTPAWVSTLDFRLSTFDFLLWDIINIAGNSCLIRNNHSWFSGVRLCFKNGFDCYHWLEARRRSARVRVGGGPDKKLKVFHGE